MLGLESGLDSCDSQMCSIRVSDIYGERMNRGKRSWVWKAVALTDICGKDE